MYEHPHLDSSYTPFGRRNNKYALFVEVRCRLCLLSINNQRTIVWIIQIKIIVWMYLVLDKFSIFIHLRSCQNLIALYQCKHHPYELINIIYVRQYKIRKYIIYRLLDYIKEIVKSYVFKWTCCRFKTWICARLSLGATQAAGGRH